MDRRSIPGLDAAAINRLSESWDDGGLWDDVSYLAGRFWAADAATVAVRWHHLVLAVGNFKRQRGRRLRPELGSREEVAGPGSRFEMPGTRLMVEAEAASSWVALQEALKGASTATTTTLLAALWPDRHAVFDWRVAAAVTGLRVNAGLSGLGGAGPDDTGAAPSGMAAYVDARRWMLRTSRETSRPLVDVERALYRLSQEVGSERGRSWAVYGVRARGVLRAAG